MEKILEESWAYILYRHGEDYYLEVVCGRAAVFTVTIQLKPSEIAQFKEHGEKNIVSLANAIMASPTNFEERFTRLPKE